MDLLQVCASSQIALLLPKLVLIVQVIVLLEVDVAVNKDNLFNRIVTKFIVYPIKPVCKRYEY